MKSFFVSVVIPNYCHSEYLDQRIRTVLNQTYQNFEIIILDDCSPDGGASKRVIEKYRNDPHVSKIMYNAENSGNTFKQWEKGISIAKGDLIWIAESDDFSDSRFLQSMVDEFERHDECVLAYSTLIEVDSNGTIISERHNFRNQHFSGQYYLKHYLALANFVRNASGAVFKKSAALNVDPQYMDYPGAGDYWFWVDIVKQGSVSIVNKQYNFFRRHESVVTTKRDADGSNFIAEKIILDQINSIVPLNRFRKRLAYAYRANRFKNVEFNCEVTKNNIYKIWDVKNHSGIIDRIFMALWFRINSQTNIFI